MLESVVIFGAKPSIKASLERQLQELAPHVEIRLLNSITTDLDSASLVVSLTEDVGDFLELARMLELSQTPLIQGRFQSFEAFDDPDDDVWRSPLMDKQHKVILIEFPVSVTTLFTEVKRELASNTVSELDDSSMFSTITPNDAARVVASVAIQTLAGAKNWGQFQYSTGGKLTWYRFCVFLGETIPDANENLMAGTGLGIDRSLNGDDLKHAFGIKARGWRVDVQALWEAFLAGEQA